MRLLMGTALLTFLILSGDVTRAAQITIRFSGVIGSVSAPSPYGDQLKAGDAYSATFLFDSSTPDTLPDDPQTGSYRALSSAILAGRVTFAGSSDGGILTILNGPDKDTLRLLAHDVTSGYPIGDATFTDLTAGVFSNDALPLPATAPSLNAFQEITFEGGDGHVKFDGTITSLEITPEPGTLFLMLLAAAFACRRG